MKRKNGIPMPPMPAKGRYLSNIGKSLGVKRRLFEGDEEYRKRIGEAITKGTTKKDDERRECGEMKPIYVPKGKAREYGDYAVNIYTGCPHGCYYCFAPQVLHRERGEFHSHVEPRKNIINEITKQLEREKITGKLIHLCFTCDPYPTGYDTSTTREVIKLLKAYGNHVQILTKGDGSRDFDLLDGEDWYGVTITGAMPESEPFAASYSARKMGLEIARNKGIKTWVSFEPVINPDCVLSCIKAHAPIFDKVKIGKLNYWASGIDWADFGRRAEELCKELGLEYYIKDSLRAEMEKT